MLLRNSQKIVGAILLLSLVFSLTGTLQASNDAIEIISLSDAQKLPNQSSVATSISGDGRFVVFETHADNMVPGSPNLCIDNSVVDLVKCRNVYVRDRLTQTTEIVSVTTSGVEANCDSGASIISQDGNIVAFISCFDSNTLGIYVHDRATGQTTLAVADNNSRFALSHDGRYIAFFSSDWDFQNAIYILDRQTQTTDSIPYLGGGSLTMSADGRYVAFQHEGFYAAYDVTLYDRYTQQGICMGCINPSCGSGYNPMINADGRYLTFDSDCNLVSGDNNGNTDVYLYDRQTQQTTLVSRSSTGVEGNGDSGSGNSIWWGSTPSISGDGRFVAFGSNATNLASCNPTLVWQMFVRDRQTGKTICVNVPLGTSQTAAPTLISADGQSVAFTAISDLLTDKSGYNLEIAYATRNPFLPIPPDVPPALNYYSTLPLTLTWGRVSWATGYKVQVDTNSTFPAPVDFEEEVSSTELSATITSLPGNTYYWRVQAKKADGTWGSWSQVQSFVLAGS